MDIYKQSAVISDTFLDHGRQIHCATMDSVWHSALHLGL